jgi:hypothetical protein
MTERSIYPRENPIDLGMGRLQLRLFMDLLADYPYLPGLDLAAPGSNVYVLETGDVYILSKAGVWEVQ